MCSIVLYTYLIIIYLVATVISDIRFTHLSRAFAAAILVLSLLWMHSSPPSFFLRGGLSYVTTRCTWLSGWSRLLFTVIGCPPTLPMLTWRLSKPLHSMELLVDLYTASCFSLFSTYDHIFLCVSHLSTRITSVSGPRVPTNPEAVQPSGTPKRSWPVHHPAVSPPLHQRILTEVPPCPSHDLPALDAPEWMTWPPDLTR